MALELNLDSFKTLPGYQKAVVGAIPVILLLGAFVWFVYMPKNAEIAAIEQQIAQVNNDINVNQAKARRLEDLKRENAELAKQLTLLKEQLPPESEVAMLLKQVSDLGIKTGLDFRLWKPSDRRPGGSGLYTEIPVDVEVAGAYHAVGAFFDRIGTLPRIVNVSGLKMAGARVDKGRLMIQTTFKATAFAAIDETAAPVNAGGAKGKPAPGAGTPAPTPSGAGGG
ncbi:MAG: type 4a pilus biogenesis protein PilO [Nitrospirota bacterium]